jgi:hypothetical protein
MLSLRGRLRVAESIDVEDGVEDLQEAARLLTKRALESPRETATQNDFQENLGLISSVLVAAGKKHEATTICNTAIEQLECIASAGTLTGAESWNEILAQLRSTLQ